MIHDLNERARQILRLVIDAYVETGEPVGSKLISQMPGVKLSPATIRNAMGELEELGLLYSPHTSAGRLPTDSGMTVFVEGLLEVSDLNVTDRETIDRGIKDVTGKSLPDIWEQTSTFLSGLSSCAGLVFAPKAEAPVRQIDFVLLAPGRALVVIVDSTGGVENRMMEVPVEITASMLKEAANYLNAHVAQKTLPQAIDQIKGELSSHHAQLDRLTAHVVESGIASLAPRESGGHLFIRGQSKLLDDVTAITDLDRIRSLLSALEAKENMLALLQSASAADGVKIFIGAENKLFGHSGCSLIVAPCKNQDAQVIGAIGVIGPTRLNYGRIIPVVSYTSQVISKIIG